MNQRQTIDQNGDVITGLVAASYFLILVDHLQAVVVNIFLVDQNNVFGGAVVAL
jgi:hypothetical protein